MKFEQLCKLTKFLWTNSRVNFGLQFKWLNIEHMQMCYYSVKCKTLRNLRPPMLWMYPQKAYTNNIQFERHSSIKFCLCFSYHRRCYLKWVHRHQWQTQKKNRTVYTNLTIKLKWKKQQRESNLKNEPKNKPGTERHGRVPCLNVLALNITKYGWVKKNSVNSLMCIFVFFSFASVDSDSVEPSARTVQLFNFKGQKTNVVWVWKPLSIEYVHVNS